MIVNTNERNGLFIVIEGPDASGKETQAGKLAEWLREENASKISKNTEEKIIEKMPGKYPQPEAKKVKDNIEDGVWRLSFPTYSQTSGGRVVQSYLNGELGSRQEISVDTIVDIYAADRKQFKPIIQEYLSNGGLIVCDRYREANLIHQLVDYNGNEWEKKLKQIKKVDSDLPEADRIYYLDISPETAIKRMKDKDRDIHEDDNSYMEKSNNNGRKVAKYEDWNIIDGERNVENVTNSLKKNISQLL